MRWPWQTRPISPEHVRASERTLHELERIADRLEDQLDELRTGGEAERDRDH